MDLPIDPTLALVGLPLGSPKQAVRVYFKICPQRFQRTSDDEPADYWPDLGVFAYYNAAGSLEALELADSASPTLSGHILTSLPVQKAKHLLRRLDQSAEDDGQGVISKKLGLGLWSGAGAHGMVQAVMRFAPGYFD